jgi:hypothetical protein
MIRPACHWKCEHAVGLCTRWGRLLARIVVKKLFDSILALKLTLIHFETQLCICHVVLSS